MNTAFSIPAQPEPILSVTSCQAMVFKIADHWLALPAKMVFKVIPSSSLDIQPGSELAVWNHLPLVQLNLHRILDRSHVDRSTGIKYSSLQLPLSYTMIVWCQTGERCIIPVDELPVLQELSLSEAHALPPAYQRSISNLAHYMVIHTAQKTTLNILLLDLQQALTQLPH